MITTQLALIAVLAPAAFSLIALTSRYYSKKIQLLKSLTWGASILSMIIAAVSILFVAKHQVLQTPLLGIYDVGMSIRLDALSVLMFSMISVLSFIILRFSANYLDGDQKQGLFLGRLAATISAVQLLVLSANIGLLFIAWVLTSVFLHRLLVFYPNRHGAIIAARKKFIVARLGDLCLLASVVLMYIHFGTGDLEQIFQSISQQVAIGVDIPGVEIIALLLVGAALLKSAQFPTHGWLIEVMETPTPVSALLHAGLLNAGPFLMIRMAHLLDVGTFAPKILVLVGGFTALFASVAFLTQTSIKTALGYSSVAHMGFSLMVCGLGAYSAAMLHLVAHSFYKAHSFLSSGSVIDWLKGTKIKSIKRTAKPAKILLGVLLGFTIYTIFAIIWKVNPLEDTALFTIGGIVALGLSRLFTSAIDSTGSTRLLIHTTFLAILVSMSFFSLESIIHNILNTQLPAKGVTGLTEIAIMSGILTLFGIVVFIQIAAPRITSAPLYRRWAIHMKNGLYMNAIFDRLVNALYVNKQHKIADEYQAKSYEPHPKTVDLESYETNSNRSKQELKHQLN